MLTAVKCLLWGLLISAWFAPAIIAAINASEHIPADTKFAYTDFMTVQVLALGFLGIIYAIEGLADKKDLEVKKDG